MLGPLLTLLALAAVVPGQTTNQSTPPPSSVAPGPKPAGYYMMQGNRIVSAPFANVNDCYKALAKLKSTLQPGLDNVVCAHRTP
jgi:hypothetical protein